MNGTGPVNPYQSPTAYQDEMPAAGNPLLIPGVFLLVLAIVMLVLLVLTIPGRIAEMRELDTTTHVGQVDLVVSIVILVGWICMIGSIICGSIGMVRLRGYRSSWVAAVLAVIPFCSPCFVLGIPFGIWALVVLSRKETRARFQE